jgi:hypothetical protein
MKKILCTGLLLSAFATAIAGNEPKTSAPPAKEETLQVNMTVYGGTYRSSRLGRFLFGNCKHSPTVCMVVYTSDEQQQSSSVRVNDNGLETEYEFINSQIQTVTGDDGGIDTNFQFELTSEE